MENYYVIISGLLNALIIIYWIRKCKKRSEISIEKAVFYLKERAIDVDNAPPALLTQYSEIIPALEVSAVLRLLKEGEFDAFYSNHQKNKSSK